MKKITYLCLLFIAFCLTTFAQEAVTYQEAFQNLTFEFPVEIQNAGDSSNRLFVVEQSGKIKVFDNDPNTSQQKVFLDLTNEVSFSFGQEIGLLGLAFHPEYNQNGYFYVYYTRYSSVANVGVEIVIARYNASSNNSDQADVSSRLEILSFDKNQEHSNHNGGKIGFGPDGYLYASFGDGGGGGDPNRNAQNLDNPFGSILRIDVDVDGNNPLESNPDLPNGNYEIPNDNPRVGSSGMDELYAWGIRNTWKFSFDTSTNIMWGADVGQGEFEEINLIQKEVTTVGIDMRQMQTIILQQVWPQTPKLDRFTNITIIMAIYQ
ncbi:PQQ-dependent sugar dehydrogenase [Maribacter halichondriae]|uniref:PQQ-dependent sugar dehydrogenase n=1 Tax=Maribacter halichondriae TaxID=2980554 RepID=UPI002359F199|nr:PQQ-dependent sugar dehydrogenase [Maribacter sp. Hal144]